MSKSCPPCNLHCKQGRECPAPIALRQKPVSLPEELRKLVERLTTIAASRRPFA